MLKVIFGNNSYLSRHMPDRNLPSSSWFVSMVIIIASFTSCSNQITETGKATYYADKFNGRKTSNGETFRQRKKTAAHKTLPFGRKVKVTNLANGRSVRVRINDRGPFVTGRTIDLSRKAARRIGMIDAGVANVQLKYKKE